MKKIKAVLILVVLLLLQNITFAQKQQATFEHLTTRDGLSHGWVHCIFQDSYGFIWIGTNDGLNKYDGMNFIIYKHKLNDSSSIISSCVFTILEDSIGDLWLGTRNGVCKYKRKTNEFISNKSWKGDGVNVLKINKNKLWVGSNNRLFFKTGDDDNLVLFETDNNKNGNLSELYIASLCIDSKDRLWVGTSYGLNLYDDKKNIFNKYFHDENIHNSLSGNFISSIFEDKYGRLWIATRNSGLNLLVESDLLSEKLNFIRFQHNPNNINSINANAVMEIIEDKKQNLCIGLENGGIDKLDISSSNIDNYKFIHHKNDPNSKLSLSNNSIHALFEDNQGTLWIGTYGTGLDKTNSSYKKFSHYMQEANNINTINNNMVNIFCEDNKYVWIGTEGGLNRYNKKTGKFKYYIHNPQNENSIGSNAICGMNTDSKGNLWVCTWAGGLNLFDYETESFKRFMFDPNDSLSIGSNNVFDISEDSDGNLWVATMGGGLNMYDPKTEMFNRYNVANTNLTNDFIEAVTITKRGEIWISNGDLACVFDKKTKIFQFFRHDEKNPSSLSGARIFFVYEDKKENIWICTEVGLNLYDRSTSGFINYNMDHGLPDNTIKSITSDNNGNLWMGTNHGLSVFYNGENIPKTPEFKSYFVEDGLQGNDFNRRSCLTTKNGELYFGGNNGFNVFHPDSIKENKVAPMVRLTGFLIFNKPVKIDSLQSSLKMNINSAKEIILTHKESVFTFKFAALNYISSENNQYAVMLEGFEENWRYIGKQNLATYTNIDAGEYKFKVKASNNDNVWNETGTSIKIIILPPFWQTWWFRGIIIVFVLGSISGFFLIRLKRIKKQKEDLEKIVDDRTAKLKESNTMLEEKQEEVLQQNEEMFVINTELTDKNEKITSQKEEIEAAYHIVDKQNDNIKGSIRYAKTIQNAVLPSTKDLNNIFDNFLIFRPKDVVSGDFYWLFNLPDFENSVNLNFIAVVDCTGHGVPGAFMSIIGTTLLNQIVKANKTYEPDEILKNLNARIKVSLKQQESNNDDGMDVCLCRIERSKDSDKCKIIYSGAKRPLFYYRQNENKLFLIKGAVKSIGGKFFKKNNFENHEIILNKGDILYLSSDGYIDQCNPERKNFSTRRLKVLFETIAQKTMKEQCEALENALETHQQGEKQRDDITILGIKL